MNLEIEILQNQAKALQEAIDREVLWTLFEESGWIRVVLPPELDLEHSVEIVEWLRESVSHPYEKFQNKFIFKDEKDAMWFKLRWLSQ
jgi:hypothetical protein